jgi:hypothetical protein
VLEYVFPRYLFLRLKLGMNTAATVEELIHSSPALIVGNYLGHGDRCLVLFAWCVYA